MEKVEVDTFIINLTILECKDAFALERLGKLLHNKSNHIGM